EAVIIDHGLQEGSAQIAERARTQAEQVGTTAHVSGVHAPSTAPGGAENAARAARHEALDRRLDDSGGLALPLRHTPPDQAEQVGTSAHVIGVQVPSTAPGGVENAARAARHEALDRRLEERGGLALLLGHTLDDQAEQVLMGLARGAGPRALAGIPRSRGAILRPFLGTGRDERTALRHVDTEEVCRLHDLTWWDDPMNADQSLLRARVRHRALPLLRELL